MIWKGQIIMRNIVKAVYENGVLKPLANVALSEHEQVEIIIVQSEDDLPAAGIAGLAQTSPSFKFLADPEEDIYTPTDGEPC